jgi:hypothetical protein
VNRQVKRATLLGLGLSAVLFLAQGCSLDTHQDSTQNKIDHGPAKVTMDFPDGFRNVAFKCNGTVGVYVTSASSDDTLPSGIAVVKDDPSCAG